MPAETPKSLGYRFPAEWEPHSATWLTYPQNPESWPDNFKLACKEFDYFVKAISKSEKVHIHVNDTHAGLKIAESLDKLGCKMGNIDFHIMLSDDCWCRDHGPVFLTGPDGSKAQVNAEFNAWGNKYPSANDRQITSKIAEITGYKVFEPGIVFEGGSIEVNGAGSILTTKACLLNEKRNPDLSQTEIEEFLRDFYCIDQILWFDEGIAGDDTDGHIDDIARFSDPSTILLVTEHDRKGINYKTLQANRNYAKKFKLSNGTQPTIVELPLPDQKYTQGNPLPASYANFYICNAGVIVPVFNCKNDKHAVDIITHAFPAKEIIPLLALNIIHGLGSWHCLSQQEPAINEYI